MVELEILSINQTEDPNSALVLLRHETQVLPIVVGIPEASAIHFGLRHEKTLRPMTHDLVCNLLAGLRAVVQSVTIYQLKDDTFFAHLNVEQKNAQGQTEQILRIDSRSSDAIAIAVRAGSPIYAAEEVMAAAAKDAAILGGMDAEDLEEDDEDDEMDDDFA
jgi:uncharacterized protein